MYGDIPIIEDVKVTDETLTIRANSHVVTFYRRHIEVVDLHGDCIRVATGAVGHTYRSNPDGISAEVVYDKLVRVAPSVKVRQ